ncbi:MAG: hypothetical protein R6T83_03170 [Salinibacter sp.]
MSRTLGLAVLTVVFLVAFPLHAAQAQTEGSGIGASIGTTNSSGQVAQNPVGLTAKTWLSDRHALSGMTTFYIGGTQTRGGGSGTPESTVDPSYWLLQADYLFHDFNELQVDDGYLALYVGAGAQFTVLEDTDNQLALRAPIGADYMLGSAPVDIFVEVAPTVNVTDPAAFRFDGAIGFRYFFSSGDGAE